MITKIYVYMFIYKHKRFRRVHKILRPVGLSDFNIQDNVTSDVNVSAWDGPRPINESYTCWFQNMPRCGNGNVHKSALISAIRLLA